MGSGGNLAWQLAVAEDAENSQLKPCMCKGTLQTLPVTRLSIPAQ